MPLHKEKNIYILKTFCNMTYGNILINCKILKPVTGH